MLLVYENRTDGIVVEWKKTVHFPPHLHEAIEVVYVTDGDIELGVGQELYHMDEGDFAIVFPNVIHHYQVFGKKENKVIYLYLDPTLFPSYYKELQIYSPKNPVVKKEQVHPDVVNAIKYLAGITEGNPMLIQAYVQMILAHVFAEMPMVDKSTVGSDDLIYNAVEYVAKNFREKISLEKMAYDLCVSKYVLSRMFAKTFHCNFSKYVNGVRLNYAVAVCDDSRTDVEMLESAFDKLAQYQFSYEVYFTAKELLKHVIDDGEMYHLYIFDIEMPEMNGLQLAKEIRKIDAKALFVFLTGYTQYVMDVFEVITFDYISKPITVEKLESVLLKAMQYLHMIKRDFVFQFRKNQFRISCDDIVYFEKKGRQAVIHTISENFKANMTTEEIWKQLDDKVFAHIHVSYIINLGHIRAIDGDEVVMDNEERLLIARSHKQNLKEKHMEFVRRMV